jgi:site-specific DNA recombinase
LKADRDRAQGTLERARSGARPAVDVSPIVVERFGRSVREKLTTGDVPFRKAYLGSIVDRAEVDDREIRIVGRKDVLEQAVLANGGPFQGFAVLFANGAPYESRTRLFRLKSRIEI